MIKEIKMWCALCDGCNVTFEIYDGFMALNDVNALVDEMRECDDWVMIEGGKTFCPNCHQSVFNESKDQNEVFTKDSQNEGAKFLGVESYDQ